MIKSVKIERLRGIKTGALSDLGPLVVLVGPNGAGKSSVLEALMIGASDQPLKTTSLLYARRPTGAGPTRWLLWKAGAEGPALVVVETNAASRRTDIKFDGQSDRVDCKISQAPPLPGTSINFQISTWTSANQYPDLNLLLDGVKEIRLTEARAAGGGQVPLPDLYSMAVEQGNRETAKAIILHAIPEVKDLEILTTNGNPVMGLVFDTYAVPIGLAGDGFQALVRLCLELSSLPDGVVLLEEPEIHQHPRLLRLSARAMLAAMRRGIQIILTTHSLELIDALLGEAQDDAEIEQLAVYRLNLRHGELTTRRIPGSEVAFSRSEIGDDLR